MTSAFLLLAAALAGGSLLLSGILKLGQPTLVVRAMRELRVPERLVRPGLAHAVPIVEVLIGLAVLLGTGAVRTTAALLAAGIHLVYLFIVSRAVHGRWAVECHCFGDLSAGPVTGRTIARNAVLLLSALLVVGAPVLLPSADPSLVTRVVAAVLLVVAAAWLRIRSQKARQAATEQLTLHDVDGAPIPLAEFEDPPAVLVFFSSSCAACHDLVDRFRWWPNALPEGLDLQPVFLGRPEAFATRERFEPLAPYAWYDHDRAVANAVGVRAAPAAVLINSQNPTGSGAVSGRGKIEDLLISHGAHLPRD
ncbi:peroxiredoxin family protein [Demetria terragena]|uniref:peroxiredoxin family protein n=1 Tax=Demetria terragena TaxID=63959 RepID=UPI00037776E9|nr:MauE/DoxX family redox-associated membrane protein [Demetria terragena]